MDVSFAQEMMSRDQFAQHTGAILEEISEGHAVATMRIQPFHLNGMGVVQGGATFTLADYAFAAACNSYGIPAVAVNNTIAFLKAGSGEYLRAESREVGKSRKLGHYETTVTNDQGEIVAVMNSVAYRK